MEQTEQIFGTRLRADAYAKAVNVLEAADRLLRVNPTATLDDIAREAGASRATVYRRFPTRHDLIVAMSRWAIAQIVRALEEAKIDSVPPYVALYQATRNVIGVKVSLQYARTLAPADDAVVVDLQSRMRRLATALLNRCQDTGLVDADIDPEWVLAVFYALVHEASIAETSAPADERASQVVDTLLRGVGPARGQERG